MISPDQESDLIDAAASAGVGPGDLEAVIAAMFDFATNSKKRPIDRITPIQAIKLIRYFKDKAAKR